MRLTVTTFVSVDGVAQAPGGRDEDRDGGFQQGGWVAPFVDEDFGRVIDARFSRVEAFLLGRKTYEIFAGYWPKITDPGDPIAAALNTKPKYVASTTLREADWAGTTVLSGDVVKEIAELKARPGGELQVHGSVGLVRTLVDHDLVDEFEVLVFPVVLGQGKRLFAEGVRPTGLRLTRSETTGSGVAVHTYEAAGRPEYRDISTVQES